MKVIIDCDPGLDDSMAIMMAVDYHKKKKIDILAITCVHGNTTVDNSSRNVSRILDAMDVHDVRSQPIMNTPLFAVYHYRSEVNNIPPQDSIS